MNKCHAGDYPSVTCCEDLPVSVILLLNGRQALKILVTTVAVIHKVTFTWTCYSISLVQMKCATTAKICCSSVIWSLFCLEEQWH